MKIGILTFQTTNNFGAILQSYALQQVLKNYGHEPEVINYQCEYISKPYRLLNLKKKGVAGYLFGLIGYICYLPRTKCCNNFRKIIKYTSPLDSQSINAIEDSYDMYIAGSDQIWNYKLTNGDFTYLLDFVKKDSKKFSYAASIGVNDIEPIYQESYKMLLEKFSRISVREKQGAELIEHLAHLDAHIVLDPTLLLAPSDWLKVAKKPKINENYILVYQLGISQKLVRFVKMLSDKKR